MLRLRVPLSLVAVFVLVAVVVGLLIGGRLIQDWNSFRTSSPAGDVYRSEVAQLEAVPLRIPTVQSYIECFAKNGPFNSLGSFGSGPVYGGSPAYPYGEGGISTSDWGEYQPNLAWAETRIAGPILIRARDLFTNQPLIFVGRYAAGTVIGHDKLGGAAVEQHTELVFDTSQASNTPSTLKFALFAWPFTVGVPKNFSGSSGWQIDGVGFSEVFLAC